MNSEGAIHFKVHFLFPHVPPSIKEFSIEQNLLTGISYLNQKLINVHPGIKGEEFSVYWKDVVGNLIQIGSDNELRKALAKLPVIKIIYVQVMHHCEQNRAQFSSICHECKSRFTEIYFCKTCGINLCIDCKFSPTHERHSLIRIKMRNQLCPVWTQFPNGLSIRVAPHLSFPKKYFMFRLARPPGEKMGVVNIEEERAKVIRALGALFGYSNPDWLDILIAAEGIEGARREIIRLLFVT